MEHSNLELWESAAFHNIHHRKFVYNFGLTPFFDEWCGTRAFPNKEKDVAPVVDPYAAVGPTVTGNRDDEVVVVPVKRVG